MSNQPEQDEVHEITEVPVPEEAPAPAGHTFSPGEIVVAEADTAYSFTEASNYAEFNLTPMRRAVMVTRLRMVADSLEEAGR